MSMNYRGDQTATIADQIAAGSPMGPNYLGEHVWPTGATYDADRDRTVVTFSLVPPPQALELLTRMIARSAS